MQIPRLFHPGKLQEKAIITLSSNASHHLLQVLRFKLGGKLTVFNGEGGEFSGTLIEVHKKAAVVELTEYREQAIESPLSIELGQGISRGERMDYVIQKAVELGVTSITPLFTERCEVKLSPERAAKRLAHWEGIALHAAEQSGRYIVPNINPPTSLAIWLSEKRTGLQLLCNPLSACKIKTLDISTRATLLIGPEGGLSEPEITLAEKFNFTSVSLGPRVLRTETATVAALTILQSTWGDL